MDYPAPTDTKRYPRFHPAILLRPENQHWGAIPRTGRRPVPLAAAGGAERLLATDSANTALRAASAAGGKPRNQLRGGACSANGAAPQPAAQRGAAALIVALLSATRGVSARPAGALQLYQCAAGRRAGATKKRRARKLGLLKCEAGGRKKDGAGAVSMAAVSRGKKAAGGRNLKMWGR